MRSRDAVAGAAAPSEYEALLAIDQSVLDAIPAAVCICSADGAIVRFNRRATKLWGRSPRRGDVKERFCGASRLYRPDGKPLPHAKTPIETALRTGKAQRDKEVVVERPDGSRVTVLVNIQPLKNSAGRIQGAINCFQDITERKRAEEELRAQTDRYDTLNRVAKTISGDLDLERIVQAVTDAATELSGAKFGAFFYNVADDQGERLLLFTLSGAPRSAFEKFGLPRNTAVFEPTFRGTAIVRSDDIRRDPRYGKAAPHYGMPKGHLPVVSYMAVPVVSRSGEVHGGLFFGHDSPGVFTKDSEEIVAAIAAHAAIAIDNARLLEASHSEVAQRRRAEVSLARRMDEQVALYRFTNRLYRAESPSDVYDSALDAILRTLRCQRVSILLFDESQVMRFVAWRSLSDAYRESVEGHSPWTPDTKDPQPICIDDVERADIAESLKAAVKAEGIGALAFIPLVASGAVIGKFMAYYDAPHAFTDAEVDLAVTIARQLGFSLQRMRAEQAHRRTEEELRRNEERLRLATQTGKVGLWEWDIAANHVSWTDSLYPMHGVDKDSFRATVEGFAALVHPDDRDYVADTIERSLTENAPYEIEFRAVRPDGDVVWLFTNAIVLRDGEKPVRMLGATFDMTEHVLAEDKFRLAVEAAPSGMILADGGGRIVLVNADAEKLFGYSRDELVGQRIEMLVPERFRGNHPGLRAEYADRPTARPMGAGRDLFALRKDGSEVPVEIGLSPIKTNEGLMILSAIVDISERKRAETQRELLLAELNHRVKNTLATVQGIAAQTFRGNETDPRIRERFEARLVALSNAQSILTQENWEGADLRHLIARALRPLASPERLQLEGPPIRLSPKAAVTIAMAMHELGTNAVKYGALSNETGRVAVRWSVNGSAPAAFNLEWKESGGPPVSAPQRRGFGSRLIERNLAHDLDGQARIDFCPDGLLCTIASRLESVASL
jgi:PAS domain S-box-containing protein